MTTEELGSLYPVILEEYNEDWPDQFEKEKDLLIAILGPETALRIEHIGSTAVPSLAAKPTVDILVAIPADVEADFFITRMTENNYIYMKEQKQHLMFVKGYSPAGLEKESYHIHMGPEDQAWLWDRLYFRDYLRKHKSEAETYAELKKN